MLRFSNVIADSIDSPINLVVAIGESAAVITSREQENDALVRLILGFQSPRSGVFTLNVEEPALLKEREISLYRKKVGVIYRDGGFISNLNLWENLTLQIAFEGLMGSDQIEKLGRSALEKVGYKGRSSVPISHLSLFQRRQIAFARALLANPDLMIYQSTFEGLSRAEQEHLAKLAWDYQGHGGKTSLFLTTYPESLRGMNFSLTYHIGDVNQP